MYSGDRDFAQQLRRSGVESYMRTHFATVDGLLAGTDKVLQILWTGRKTAVTGINLHVNIVVNSVYYRLLVLMEKIAQVTGR